VTGIGKAVVVGAVLSAVALVVGARRMGAAREGAAASQEAAPAALQVPRLVDLGADRCMPCKAMAPILAQLRADFAGRLDVTFIDVWKTPEAAQPYGIRSIPTQIFYGADGRELARHQGFMSREQILAQWKSLGVEL
jgi:thioredoxin 1